MPGSALASRTVGAPHDSQRVRGRDAMPTRPTGAYIGDGAVIDHQFGTTDVLVIMPVEAIKTRYFAHFGAPDELSTGHALDFAPLN